MQQQTDTLIKNAAAILAAINLKPSPKAEKEAFAALSEKRDFKAFLNKGNENNRLFFRVLSSLIKPCETFDTSSLLKLHAFLFDGIKPEAGKLRNTEMTCEGAGFADSSLISGSLKRLLSKMNEILATSSPSDEDFALKLTYFFSEMFLLCPFRFGSLAAQAVFFHNFALSRGFDLNYDACGGARLCEAVRVAFLTDEPSGLFMCLNDAVSRVATVSTGETVVLEIAQRELKRGKTKTLVKAGTGKDKKESKGKPAKKAAEKSERKPKPESRKKEPPTVGESREADKEASILVNLTELSSDTLKKAAKLKEKIEQLQKQLSMLLTPAEEAKPEAEASAEKSEVAAFKSESKTAAKRVREIRVKDKAEEKRAEKTELVKINADGLPLLQNVPKPDGKP